MSLFSGRLGTLLCYAWVNIPLVYTQIVTLSVNIYFGVALLGRQHLTPTRYVGAAGDYVKDCDIRGDPLILTRMINYFDQPPSIDCVPNISPKEHIIL